MIAPVFFVYREENAVFALCMHPIEITDVDNIEPTPLPMPTPTPTRAQPRSQLHFQIIHRYITPFRIIRRAIRCGTSGIDIWVLSYNLGEKVKIEKKNESHSHVPYVSQAVEKKEDANAQLLVEMHCVFVSVSVSINLFPLPLLISSCLSCSFEPRFFTARMIVSHILQLLRC